jgi:YVTN family beta-propeller protein
MNAVKIPLMGLIAVEVVASLCSAASLSPEYLAVSPDGKTIYVTAATAGKLLLFDVTGGMPAGEWKLPGDPSGVSVAADGTVYVSGGGAEGELYKLGANGKFLAKVATGHTPTAPVVAKDGKTVFVLNRFNNNVAAVDAATMTIIATIPVPREPSAAALGKEGKLLFVANLLPNCCATDTLVAAAISVIDTSSCKLVENVMLPNGSTGVRGIGAAPDGRFVYVAHTLGHYQLPTMQLEHGWVSTAALSVFNGETGQYVNTVLLDDVNSGAANPWGVTVSQDGKKLIVAHAGTHEISVIDRETLHARLDKAAKNEKVTAITKSAADVPSDLSFLVGIRRRVKLAGNGPRSAAVVGNRVYSTVYFSDALAAVKLDDTASKPVIFPLGPTAGLNKNDVRRGEMFWNDSTMCYRQWVCCATCHPDARADGLNWDLLNDGLGNSKNTRSMLLGVQTGPTMALGVRKNTQAAVRAGITHIQFLVRPEEDAKMIDEYLASLRPISSPHLVGGRMSAAAKRGEKMFFDTRVGCAECHPKPTYSDGNSHDVGSAGAYDRPTDKFYTPSLLETWRTAPYMHDGRYLTIKDLIVRGKHGGQGGNFDHLTEQQMNDLAEFVSSL